MNAPVIHVAIWTNRYRVDQLLDLGMSQQDIDKLWDEVTVVTDQCYAEVRAITNRHEKLLREKLGVNVLPFSRPGDKAG
jgi:hypothetical protein